MNRAPGFVLVSALVVIALMMAGGALLAALLQQRMWLLRQEVQDINLTALADAGLAFALDRLALSPGWSGAGEQTIGEGTFAVDVEMGDQAMTRVVTVTAVWGRGGRVVRAVARLSDLGPPRVISWQPVAFSPASPPGRSP